MPDDVERRRFPVPSTFEDYNDACFIVKDANGLAMAYVYYDTRGCAVCRGD
jgi:hypothetical protein